MNDLTVNIIITAITFFIVFLAGTFSPYLSMRGLFFGVRLEEQHKKDPAIKRITKTYLWQCTVSFISLLAITLWYLSTCTTEQQLAFAIISATFLLLGLLFAFYVRAYEQIKAFTHDLEVPTPKAGKTVVDTDFMKEKNKLKKYFQRLYIVPLIIVVISSICTLVNYSALPEIIPIHWNFLGEADGWQVKSLMNVGLQSFMQFLLLALLFYVSKQIFSTRGKLDTENYEQSKKVLLQYLKGMGYSIYFMTLSINFLFLLTTFAMISGTNLPLGVMLFGLFLPFVSGIYMFVVWFKYRKNTSVPTNTYSPENEDSHWIWGSFYNNPNDPSVFVEKRYGIGWTINLGTPLGKIIMIATLIFIVAAVFLPFFTS